MGLLHFVRNDGDEECGFLTRRFFNMKAGRKEGTTKVRFRTLTRFGTLLRLCCGRDRDVG